jgi:hypothetical protein
MSPPASLFAIKLAAQMFGDLDWTHAGDASQSAFNLDRAELGATITYDQNVGAELRLDSFRAAGEQSLLAVQGDPLLIGVKRAWGWADHDLGDSGVKLGGRLGMIPDPWISAVEPDYALLPLSLTEAEAAGLIVSSDLGGGITAQYGDQVFAQVAITNGEGRNQIEQNTGKDTNAVVSVTAATLDIDGSPVALRVHLGGREGSVGTARVRSHRLEGAVTLAGLDHGAGVEAIKAYGVGDRGDEVSTATAGWVRGRIVDRLGFAARVAWLDPDGGVANDAETSAIGALYYDLVPPALDHRARVYAAGFVRRYGTAAPPLPGGAAAANASGVSLILELDGEVLR